MGYFYGVMVKELNIQSLISTLPVMPVNWWNMHVTLVYIGTKRPSQDTEAKVKASVTSIPCFRVKLGQLILLPNLVKPRVLAVEVIDNGWLSKLRSIMLSALRDSGVLVDDEYLGSFKPHITIAYIKSKRIDADMLLESARELGIEDELMGKFILVNNVSLILAKGGNYTEISRHELQC